MAITSSSLIFCWLLYKVLQTGLDKAKDNLSRQSFRGTELVDTISCWLENHVVDHFFRLNDQLSKIFRSSFPENKVLSETFHAKYLCYRYKETAAFKWTHVNMIYLFHLFQMPNNTRFTFRLQLTTQILIETN